MGRENQKIIAISDTHNRHKSIIIPKCDILIHAGDATNRGEHNELAPFLNWFSEIDCKYKVFVPGNHDFYCERMPEKTRMMCEDRGITLLNDSGVELDGLKIWGSPIQPWFHSWAFNRSRGSDIRQHWSLIPSGLDILITHGPPYQILDETPMGEAAGCEDLLYTILEKHPKVHIFGHIHDGYGQKEFDGIKFYNVASCSESYQPVNPPVEIIL